MNLPEDFADVFRENPLVYASAQESGVVPSAVQPAHLGGGDAFGFGSPSGGSGAILPRSGYANPFGLGLDGLREDEMRETESRANDPPEAPVFPIPPRADELPVEEVCDKVQQKGHTTYQHVAKELVQEFVSSDGNVQQTSQAESKNIRRRVYDALNVLEALGLIRKDKKERGIVWNGPPWPAPAVPLRGRPATAPAAVVQDFEQKQYESFNDARHTLEELARENEKLKIDVKDATAQYEAMIKLLERNHDLEVEERDRVDLPFLLIRVPRSASIDVRSTVDQTTHSVEMDEPFVTYGENDVLPLLQLSSSRSRT